MECPTRPSLAVYITTAPANMQAPLHQSAAVIRLLTLATHTRDTQPLETHTPDTIDL